MRAVDDWRPPKAMTNFGLFIFLPEIRWPERLDGVVPYRHRPARRLSQVYANDTADFWLVVAFSYAAGAIELRGPVALSICFICRSIRRPKRWVHVLPHAFRPFASPLQRPPPHRHHRSVGCCISPSRGSHPRPVLRPSLNLSMGAILAPQTRGSVAVSANPGTGHLQ